MTETPLAVEAAGFCFEYPAAPADDKTAAEMFESKAPESASAENAPAVHGCRAESFGKDTGSADATAGAFGRQSPARHAIGPIDWRVGVGEFQLLVGNTGSGKTTLLRNLKASVRPHGARKGSLRVMGKPFDEDFPREADQLVGFVSQSPENQLVCDNVWHEIAFGLENLGVDQAQMRRRVAEVAHFFGIEGWFDRATDDLSGGQKQIVALASVLVMQPRILVLDEPTAQLDPIAEKTFLHALFRVNRELGATVVVSTHAPQAMAEYATSAVAMRGGVLVPAELADFAAKPLDVRAFAACKPCGVRAFGDKPVLELRDVYARYDRRAPWVLHGCDLSLRKQEIRALIGGNGCGKTTLMRVAAGVLPARRGSVRNALSASQAYLPQNPKEIFVRDTALEELREWQRGAGYSDADIRRVCAELSLDGCLDLHPYDLSGGQQQLLALAKILLLSPGLIFLDEPTKGLDAEAKMLVAKALLRARAAGASIVFATHDLPFALAVADSATMLFDGQEAATQPVAEFFENSMFYRPVCDAFAAQWPGGKSNGGQPDDGQSVGGQSGAAQPVAAEPCCAQPGEAQSRDAQSNWPQGDGRGSAQ